VIYHRSTLGTDFHADVVLTPLSYSPPKAPFFFYRVPHKLRAQPNDARKNDLARSFYEDGQKRTSDEQIK
jgi:hypothetical protein